MDEKKVFQADLIDGLKINEDLRKTRNNPKLRVEYEQDEDIQAMIAEGGDPYATGCPGCWKDTKDAPIHARGLCKKCYQKAKYYGLLNLCPKDEKEEKKKPS